MCLYIYDPASENPIHIKLANEGISFKSPIRTHVCIDVLIKNTTNEGLSEVLIIYPRSFSTLKPKSSPKGSPWKLRIKTGSPYFEFDRGSLLSLEDSRNTFYKMGEGYKELKDLIRSESDLPEGSVKLDDYLVDCKDFGHYDFSDKCISEDSLDKYRVILNKGNFAVLRLGFAKPISSKSFALFRLRFSPDRVGAFESRSGIYFVDSLYHRLWKKETKINFAICCPNKIREKFLAYLSGCANGPRNNLRVFARDLHEHFADVHRLDSPKKNLEIERYRIRIFPNYFSSLHGLKPFFRPEDNPHDLREAYGQEKRLDRL